MQFRFNTSRLLLFSVKHQWYRNIVPLRSTVRFDTLKTSYKRMSLDEKVKSLIRDVKDFPKPGIIFKDITPVFDDPLLVDEIVRSLSASFSNQQIDAVAAIEARGFIFGSMLAHALKCRFIPIRKAGKLPY